LVPIEIHPKARGLFEYWLSIHPDTGLPGRQHLDPLDIPDLLPYIWLLDVRRTPPRFRYRLVGTKLAEIYGRDHAGRWIDEVFPHFAETLTAEHLRLAVETGLPQWREGVPLLVRDKDFLRTTRLFLPMASDGKAVDMILAFTIFLDSSGREI